MIKNVIMDQDDPINNWEDILKHSEIAWNRLREDVQFLKTIYSIGNCIIDNREKATRKIQLAWRVSACLSATSRNDSRLATLTCRIRFERFERTATLDGRNLKKKKEEGKGKKSHRRTWCVYVGCSRFRFYSRPCETKRARGVHARHVRRDATCTCAHIRTYMWEEAWSTY